MFRDLSKITHSFISVLLLLIISIGLIACKSEQPELMKAVKQFESDEIRDKHATDMRRNHMHELLHKRDETVYEGIRTKKYSLKECINCHIPEKHNGKVLRHTNPQHFCATCHVFVAQQLDCFNCHVDHPVKETDTANTGTKDQAAHTPDKPDLHQIQKPDNQTFATNHTNNRGDAASE